MFDRILDQTWPLWINSWLSQQNVNTKSDVRMNDQAAAKGAKLGFAIIKLLTEQRCAELLDSMAKTLIEAQRLRFIAATADMALCNWLVNIVADPTEKSIVSHYLQKTFLTLISESRIDEQVRFNDIVMDKSELAAVIEDIKQSSGARVTGETYTNVWTLLEVLLRIREYVFVPAIQLGHDQYSAGAITNPFEPLGRACAAMFTGQKSDMMNAHYIEPFVLMVTNHASEIMKKIKEVFGDPT